MTSGDQNAGASGSTRSARKVTGSASAAKFVPQRGENRDGFAAPVHVERNRRSSAAAMARCSAPCRWSARPRRIVKSSATESTMPPSVGHGRGRNAKPSGRENRREDDERSRARATPRRRKIGRERGPEPDEPAGERQPVESSGGCGIRPSRSEPSTPANAQ